jgi:serine/threonine protein kinase
MAQLSLPLKETDLVGTVLGDRYEILELIGDGAMGQVYKAKHRLLKRIVAVKMMHPNLVSGAAALKRFQKEAELASALNHPNILTVYDFGVTDGGVPYLVMAFLEGTSLAEQIAGGANLELKRSVPYFQASQPWPCPRP